jgi:hypothetical protein
MYYFMWAMLLWFTLMGIVIVFWFDAPLRVRIASGICQILFVFTTYEVMKRN